MAWTKQIVLDTVETLQGMMHFAMATVNVPTIKDATAEL